MLKRTEKSVTTLGERLVLARIKGSGGEDEGAETLLGELKEMVARRLPVGRVTGTGQDFGVCTLGIQHDAAVVGVADENGHAAALRRERHGVEDFDGPGIAEESECGGVAGPPEEGTLVFLRRKAQAGLVRGGGVVDEFPSLLVGGDDDGVVEGHVDQEVANEGPLRGRGVLTAKLPSQLPLQRESEYAAPDRALGKLHLVLREGPRLVAEDVAHGAQLVGDVGRAYDGAVLALPGEGHLKIPFDEASLNDLHNLKRHHQGEGNEVAQQRKVTKEDLNKVHYRPVWICRDILIIRKPFLPDHRVDR
mmetsp:Transcript_20448/g.57598  ORF Transcript_20448/g.57598 Transcript_20448/m.57598 type:complete len:306 (-) Transcript_20448:1084-2001(-)